MLGNFSRFCCLLLTLYKMCFQVSHSLDLDPHYVGPDLGPNTVYSEIFARALIIANETLAKWRNHSVVY